MEAYGVQITEVNEDGQPISMLVKDLLIGDSVEFRRLLPSDLRRGDCDDPECSAEFHSTHALGAIVFEMHLN